MSDSVVRARSGREHALYAAITIALGLASRRYAAALPSFIAEYAGDTLWATMVFLVCACVFRRAQTRVLAGAALATAFLVEMSQLYRADWIDAIRNTTLGALALGSGFLWSDLVCYTVGVGLGVAIDTATHLASTRWNTARRV